VVKTKSSSFLRFEQRSQLDFAKEALRALGGDHGHSVGHVLRGQYFAWILGPAAGKLAKYAAGADGADANPIAAQVFRHAAAEALHGPLGSAIEPAAGEGVFSSQGADVDDVAGFSPNHGRNGGARQQEQTLQIGVKYLVPILVRSFMHRAEEADAGVVDENV